MNLRKNLYLGLGFCFLAVGIVGVVLPGLPTTPFVLLAAFCFSRGSERWHSWLINHRVFGPGIRDWENHGVIRPRAKKMATGLIVISFTSLWLVVKAHLFAKLSMVSVGILVLFFIWTRPSAPKKNAMSTKNH